MDDVVLAIHFKTSLQPRCVVPVFCAAVLLAGDVIWLSSYPTHPAHHLHLRMCGAVGVDRQREGGGTEALNDLHMTIGFVFPVTTITMLFEQSVKSVLLRAVSKAYLQHLPPFISNLHALYQVLIYHLLTE